VPALVVCCQESVGLGCRTLRPVSQSTGVSASTPATEVAVNRFDTEISEYLWGEFAPGKVCSGSGKLINAMGRAIHMLHLGERSNDLKRLPMASCRQCQTSALVFGGSLPALFFCSLAIVRR
jgi:hypothetical protein